MSNVARQIKRRSAVDDADQPTANDCEEKKTEKDRTVMATSHSPLVHSCDQLTLKMMPSNELIACACGHPRLLPHR